MFKLYEIEGLFAQFWAKIEDQGGEMLPEDEESLERLEARKESFLAECARKLISLKSDKEACEKEIARLKDVKEGVGERIETLSGVIKKLIGHETSHRTEIGVIRTKKTQSVNVVSEEDLPSHFTRVKTFVEPDKEKIASVLKAGGEVPGAELVEKRSVWIA